MLYVHFRSKADMRLRAAMWLVALLTLVLAVRLAHAAEYQQMQARFWPAFAPLRELYLGTVAKSVAGVLLKTDSLHWGEGNHSNLAKRPYDQTAREHGLDWPDKGLTMVGLARLQNIRQSLESVLMGRVPGHFVECGVWRGGASIFAKAVLASYGITNRKVILVDSFNGLPPASSSIDHDLWSRMDYLKVNERDVQLNFRAYGLLDGSVNFYKGFFNESCVTLRNVLQDRRESISVLRLDGDMFSSTTDILYNLYELVPIGGWVVIDDYGNVPEAKRALEDFLSRHCFHQHIIDIDGSGVYFIKSRQIAVNYAWYQMFRRNNTEALRLPRDCT